MEINNKWINDEDDLFLFFRCNFSLKNREYKDIVFQLNLELHKVTLKHEFLMPLSPTYCRFHGINAYEHYKKYLLNNQINSRLFQINGYEFYGQKNNGINRVSKMFFKNKKGEVESKYVHYLSNGYYGNPEVIESGITVEHNVLEKYAHDDCPLRVCINAPPTLDNDVVNVGFTIESHCSIWLDVTPNFKFQNENKEIIYFEYSDNKELACKNTPRLNSFLRDIREVVLNYGGNCTLYDYESYLETARNTTVKNRSEAEQRKGLMIDGRIVYQEDLDEGRVSFSI